jgi:hypothetical protein
MDDGAGAPSAANIAETTTTTAAGEDGDHEVWSARNNK